MVFKRSRLGQKLAVAKTEKFRNICYEEYFAGSRIVNVNYGAVNAIYKAISPKNYWHLKIGSQMEDAFMADVFTKYLGAGDVVLDIGYARHT